ncbi:hypothetical protein [Urbifossiella limnaea]|uniref:Uncharacterized protein n=1 Tax=Urbifossiella limnaea TaxID=2528023 RepID=A0A517XRY4_9BACT|nr:hypothetical protein [Urbifossiella limnaea]QDU20259.1 hypothetical protein ETAA1_22050 [Urbifossiella limnaea]
MPLTVPCPGCREPLDVDDEHRTWKVRCPRCAAEFVPDEPRPADAFAPRRPPDDDFDDRPRRRRRPRSAADDYDDAKRDVHGPSVFLELLGWLGILASVGIAFLFAAIGMAPPPGKPNQPPEAAVFALGFAGCIGVLGVGVHIPIIIGARHLRRLSSRPWAMAAAVLAVLVSSIFHLAAGIWAIIVINRLHVKNAFDDYAETGGPPHND